jgi:hypothetical protein
MNTLEEGSESGHSSERLTSNILVPFDDFRMSCKALDFATSPLEKCHADVALLSNVGPTISPVVNSWTLAAGGLGLGAMKILFRGALVIGKARSLSSVGSVNSACVGQVRFG